MNMNWHEQDHPRDTDGKFTDKGTGAPSAADEPIDPRKIVYRQNTPYWKILEDDRKREEAAQRRKNAARLPLDFFGNENRKKLTREDIPSEVYGFMRERIRTPHHERHAKEFNCKDEKEYEKRAIDFWLHGEGKIYACHYSQEFYKYNSKTKELVVISAFKGDSHREGDSGRVKTYYIERAMERKIRQLGLEEV